MNSMFLQALVFVVTAMTLIVLGDAAGKLLTAAGQSPFFVAWSRFAVAAMLFLPFARLTAQEGLALFDWRVVLRALLIVTAICCILTALRTEPMANVFGGFFVGPIVAFALSALFLKERVTLSRSLLLVISFLGVLLVVKPGGDMQVGMIFAVLAGCLHGAYLVATRWLAHDYRPSFLLFSQLAIGGVILLPLSWPQMPGVVGLDFWTVFLVAVSALGSAAGNYLLVVVNRKTPANVVAPLVYSQLLAATVVGWLVFSDWPDALAILGMAIIILSGLSSLWLAGRPARQVQPGPAS